MSRPRWYTVPAEYGGLSLPWRRRLYVEWLYRRHGTAGLDGYLGDRWARLSRRLAESLVPALNEATKAVGKLGVSFDELAETLRRVRPVGR